MVKEEEDEVAGRVAEGLVGKAHRGFLLLIV